MKGMIGSPEVARRIAVVVSTFALVFTIFFVAGRGALADGESPQPAPSAEVVTPPVAVPPAEPVAPETPAPAAPSAEVVTPPVVVPPAEPVAPETPAPTAPPPAAGTSEIVTPETPAPTAPAPTAEAPEKVTRMKPILVTGSNIPSLEEQPVAPVLRIDKEMIDRSGARTVAEVLQRIPQNNGNQSFSEKGSAGSFTPGTASVALRGFGPQQTLVLLNGRRVASSPFGDNFGGVQASFVDLNTIPVAAVESVEILKAGGSAIYGSDAIAGVVNIILRSDYNGMEISTEYGQAARSDIGEQTHSLVAGLISGKAQMMIFLDYFHRNSSFLRDRPISKKFAFNSSNGGQATFIDPRPGSPTEGERLYVPPGGAPGGVGISTNATFGTGPSANIFNTNIRLVDSPETQRYGGYTTFTYDITDNLQFFVEAAYRNIQTTFQINPTPIDGGSDGWAIGPDNPYNPFPGFSTIVKWRLFEAGPRINIINTDMAHVLPGLRLKIGESWNIETAYNYYTLRSTDDGQNFLSSNALANALSDTNPATALNPLSAPNQQNQATINSLKVRTTRQGVYDYWEYDIRASGNTIDLPAGPVAIAIGGSTRHESLSDTPDSLSDTFQIVSSGGNPKSSGSRDSDAIYWEGYLPIVSPQRNMPGVYSLQLQGAGRFEYYSDFGTTVKPAAGIKWQPAKELALRFSYSQGFRAPSLSELFIGQSAGFEQGIPDTARCMPAAPNGFPDTDDVCTGRNIQYKVLTGGNPELDAENSDSYYVEGVYQPPFMKGLTVTVGGGYIKIKDVISAPSAAFVVANPSLFPPGSVVRDAGNPAFAGDPGAITLINSQNVNINEQETYFVDFEAEYVHDTESIGTFTEHLLATYVPTFTQSSPEAGSVQLAGEGSFPKVRGSFGIYWQGPKETWAEKFGFGPVLNYWSSYNEVLYPPRRVKDWWTVDLQANYEAPWQTTITLGCQNVADRSAPRSLGQNGEGYDAAVHDNTGRFIYASVTKKF